MKAKRLILYTSIILAFSAITALIFHSCSKDDILAYNETNSSDILCFKDYNEYMETLDIIFTFNIEERKNWEESKGFKSFGTVCDEIYDSKSPEDFRSVDEIKEFVSKNDSYLRLIDDENGELTLETVLSNHQDRYFINKEKIYKINNTVYKVFANITVLTKEENINKLRKIDEKNLLSFTNSPDFYFHECYYESVCQSFNF